MEFHHGAKSPAQIAPPRVPHRLLPYPSLMKEHAPHPSPGAAWIAGLNAPPKDRAAHALLAPLTVLSVRGEASKWKELV